jgi:hypothetical protein
MPPAVLAWLDYSEADQRRAREIVRMFSQPESRDELGLGQIRDALSDTLFPGTSVLLTRARYLLFVPWFYREGVRLRRQGSQLSSWVDTQERRLIGALRNGGDSSGLIGGVVGEQVQNLPSTIYWNSLRRFGILRHDGTPTQIAGLRQASRPLDDTTEFVERSDAVWDPSMPGPPEDFFALTSCDFTLTRDEATWLAERIGQAAPDTLLEFLVEKGSRRPDGAQFAWDDNEVNAAMGQVRDAVYEARRFAAAMHGAALVYNLLLAERAEGLGMTRHDGQRDYFADLLDQWSGEVQASDLGSWNLEGLWALVMEQGRQASPLTYRFVTDWVNLVRSPSGRELASDQTARTLIREREIHQKRGQARLTNDRLIRQWGGASGSGRLNFRWPVVARLLNDIADGRK